MVKQNKSMPFMRPGNLISHRINIDKLQTGGTGL